jgi:hypothetical protein
MQNSVARKHQPLEVKNNQYLIPDPGQIYCPNYPGKYLPLGEVSSSMNLGVYLCLANLNKTFNLLMFCVFRIYESLYEDCLKFSSYLQLLLFLTSGIF